MKTPLSVDATLPSYQPSIGVKVPSNDDRFRASSKDTFDFQKTQPQPQKTKNRVFPLAILMIPLMVVGGLTVFNKNHPNVKPHLDKVTRFFGKKTELKSPIEDSDTDKMLQGLREQGDKILSHLELSNQQLALLGKTLQGDFEAWISLRTLLEQDKPETIEPLLKQTAMQGYTQFIKSLADFYLEAAGVISEKSRNIVPYANEAEKMHLYEPAFVWLQVLEGVNNLNVPTSIQEAELRIRMRRGTDNWDKLEAELKKEAQSLIDEINKNTKVRLDANINDH